MSEGARFSFSFSDGTLQVSGSELFVSQQVDNFRSVIIDALKMGALMPTVVQQLPAPSQYDGPNSQASISSDQSAPAVVASNPYPNVLDVMNDKVKITKSIKGSTIAEKSIRLILIYLWGKERLLGINLSDYRELRDICEEHACLDSSNFSGTLSAKKSWIVIDGVKGSSAKHCKLTVPGREKAAEFLREMNES